MNKSKGVIRKVKKAFKILFFIFFILLIAGAIFMNQQRKLKDINMSNVTYLYGTKDRNIRTLTEKEITFLKSKKCEIDKRSYEPLRDDTIFC